MNTRRRHRLRLPAGNKPVTLNPSMHSPADLNRAFISLLRAPNRPAPEPARSAARMAALHAAADSDARARARIDALYTATLARATAEARRLSASRAALFFSAGVLSGLLLTLSLFFK